MKQVKSDKQAKRPMVHMLNLRTGEDVSMVYGIQGWAVLDAQKVRRVDQ
jgi:hypothetical protein